MVPQLDIDRSSIDQLLQDKSIPTLKFPRRRLNKVIDKPPNPFKQFRLRWDLSLDQEYFNLTRTHTRTIQGKKGIKPKRNLRWGTYDSNLNLDWLKDDTGRMGDNRGDGATGKQSEECKQEDNDMTRVDRDVDKNKIELEIVKVGIG